MALFHISFSGEQSLHGVFEALNDKQAVGLALAEAIENHGFFPDNRVNTKYPPGFNAEQVAGPGAHGFLVLPSDAVEDPGELAYLAESENTIWIFVGSFEPNKLSE